MHRSNNAPLKPRNGLMLIVGIVARISGCADQKEISLDDQIDHAKEVVAELYGGAVDYRVIATKGKGERLDREELDVIRKMLLSGELDLLVMEDMGRLVRGVEAVRLFGVGVDHGTRCISPNDSIDTIEPTWEEDALAACRDHVAHNAHTSKRLKQKLMNRFVKSGGAPGLPIAGYIVPPDVKNYGEWQKDPDATPIIVQGLNLLKSSLNYSAVAEYFNTVPFKEGVGFPPGPYCDRKTWDGAMTRRYYRNRLLGGLPGRGFRHTVKRHETGRRVSVPNPDGPTFIDLPQLAHVDPVELDAVNAILAAKNASAGRKKVNGVDPLFRVSRKDSRFPAPIATCAYCGRSHVWGGNGVTKNLMCPGAREWHCWNSIGFDGRLATQRVMALILDELTALEAFDDQFRELVQRALAGAGDVQSRQAKLRREQEALSRKKENVQAAIAAFGASDLVKEMLQQIRIEEVRLKAEQRELDDLAKRTLELPQSVAQLRAMLQEQFNTLANTSRSFNDLLRRLVPQFTVHLVRLCDGGHLLPRAQVTLALDGIAPDAQHAAELAAFLTRQRTIDLFDLPQRAVIREQAVALAAQHIEQREIALRLSVTQTAVQKALALDRTMKSMGLETPYVPVNQPPEDYPKLRRHRNRKFRFEPLDGHQPPSL